MKAIAVPFGKRGQIAGGAPRGEADPFIPPPPNATGFQKTKNFWNACKACPFGIGQGVVSCVYHLLASAVLTIVILFMSSSALTWFANSMTPYWPLLAHARPYMDAHGRHQLFLYMCAMYFKDVALIALILLRNLYWMTIMVVGLRSNIDFGFEPRRLLGLVAPVVLIYWLDQFYYDQTQLTDSLHRSVFDGDIYRGIVGPAGADAVLVLYIFYSPFILLFRGGVLAQLKQLRTSQ
jgi:hypothetical protein